MNVVTRKASRGGFVLALALGCQALNSCDSASSEGQALRDEPACELAPTPRWVLRDKEGARVQAMVEPRCYQHPAAASAAECRPLGLASMKSYPCVRIIDHQSRYINLQYNLETGKIEPCQGGHHSTDYTKEFSEIGIKFLDEDCMGLPHLSPGEIGTEFIEPEFTIARDVVLAEGKMWYISGIDCTVVEQAYGAVGGVGCSAVLPEGASIDLCPLREVPMWVQDLLPNPPYTMAVEHE